MGDARQAGCANHIYRFAPARQITHGAPANRGAES